MSASTDLSTNEANIAVTKSRLIIVLQLRVTFIYSKTVKEKFHITQSL